MAIWLDELEREGVSIQRQPLRDRRALRFTLEQRHETADDVLLVLDAVARPGAVHDSSEDSAAQTLLRAELMRLPHEVHALRRGQLCMLLPGPVSNEQIKRLLVRLNRRLQPAWRRVYALVYGAARASEARQGSSGWLALADLRFQARAEHLGIGTGSSLQGVMTQVAERRRTGHR